MIKIGWQNPIYAEAYSELSQVSKMGPLVKRNFFPKIVNSSNPLK